LVIDREIVTPVQTEMSSSHIIILYVVFGVITLMTVIVSAVIILRRNKDQQITQLESYQETVALKLLANEVLLIYDKQDGQVRNNATSLHRTLSAAGIPTVNFK